MNPVIETHGLTKTYGRHTALGDLTLSVPEGSIYALVGSNGAGKTTLIKLLMNILHPTSGSAKVIGIDSRSLTGKAFTGIGYVSENQEMPDWMTVGAMLDYYRSFYPDWDRTLEADLVRQFDLPLDRKVKDLSRGMRMKAAFASSLAYRPSVLILDEPFTGLDPLVRDELIQGLLDPAAGTTIFLSSHDLGEIESFSSHVGFLDKGRLQFSEDMASLSERFRTVSITLETVNGVPRIPAQVPAQWLQYQASSSAVQFIDSAYKPGLTEKMAVEIFGSIRTIEATPMTLREIFLATAKSIRTSGAAA